MTYRELLELYKKSALSEEKMKEIHDDIEKQDAISEYLFDEMDSMHLDEDNQTIKESVTTDEEMQAEARFAYMVQKSIRKAFIKMGMCVLAATLVIVLLAVTILPRIVALPFYNPAKKVKGMETQLAMDISIYTELMTPAAQRSYATVDNDGWGNYRFIIPQVMTYAGGGRTDIGGTIRKGKLSLYNTDVLRPIDNVFGWDNTFFDETRPDNTTLTEYMEIERQELIDEGFKGDDAEPFHSWAGNRKEATDSLKELKSDKSYFCYVTLDSIMPYQDFMKWCEKNELLHVWSAVRTEESGIHSRIGFYDDMLFDKKETWTSDKYPNLVAGEIEGDYSKREKEAQEHFVSMMRYLYDHKKFTRMFMEDGDIDMFEDYISYVENNGLKIYGFMVRLDKKEALQLNDAEGVYEITAVEVR